MTVLEKKYHEIFSVFLFVLPVSFVSMKLANVLVLLFVIFNLVFLKKLLYTKQKLILCGVIAIPLLLEMLFIWNNSSLYLTIKSIEKYLLYLIFPLIIIGYNKRIDFNKLLKRYVVLMLVLMSILFIRYVILYPEFVSKYLNGKDLWEMGYNFTKSFDNHAPALNMNLSFVCVICFYLIFSLKKTNKLKIMAYVFQFLLSLFFLFYVNTRVAIVSSFLGFLLMTTFFVLKKENKKVVIKRALILFVCICLGLILFLKVFPYSVKKFTDRSFAHMDMVGRLDDFKNPEGEVFSALVTRASIWKSALELSERSLLIGFGATDAKEKLFDYYKETNQRFLYKYKFPVHNQFIDFLLKYGVLGIIGLIVFFVYIGYLGVVNRNPIIIFFCMHFFLSNLTDDFLILYSGISFSAFWLSVFTNFYYRGNFRKSFEAS